MSENYPDPGPDLQVSTGFKIDSIGQDGYYWLFCDGCYDRFYFDVDGFIAMDCPGCGQRWMNT